MRAVILAGGRGTRLRPFTASFPKPLVPLGDRPVVELLIRSLVEAGVCDITLTLGHLAELVQAYFQHRRLPSDSTSRTSSKQSPPARPARWRSYPGSTRRSS